MASVRCGRRCCIRGAFGAASARAGARRRQRSMLHRLKASARKNHVDFMDGVWREFLDPHVGLEDAPQASGFKDCSPADLTCHRPPGVLKPQSPEGHLEVPLPLETPGHLARGAFGAPVPLGANDVDMLEAGGPRAASPEGSELMEVHWGPLRPPVGSPETGRRVQGRARVSRPPPRRGSEKDKGPKPSLSKRKLELLLSEPKRKRKKLHMA